MKKKIKAKKSGRMLDPFFEKLKKMSKVQRILLYVLPFLAVIGLFVGVFFYPKFTTIGELKSELEKVEKELQIATAKATRLKKLREELAAAQEEFKIAGQALPDKEEIPSLLAGISQSGQDAGLEFLLFQPNPEVRKDFYAELPLALNVQGSYHNMGTFLDKVSNLSRIVNISNIEMNPASKETRELTMSATAVTYKFLEAEEQQKSTKKKKKKK
jgi:type IV pilus assembly protein PilO